MHNLTNLEAHIFIHFAPWLPVMDIQCILPVFIFQLVTIFYQGSYREVKTDSGDGTTNTAVP